MKNMTLILSTFVFLLGCQNQNPSTPSSSKAPIPTTLDGNLQKQITIKTAPLSETSKAQLIAITKIAKLKIPSTDMILNEYSPSHPEARKKDEAKLDSEGWALFNKILKKCTIEPGAEKNEELSSDKQVTTKHHRISGAECPISYTYSTQKENLFSHIDRENGAATGTTASSAQSSLILLDKEIIKRTGFGGTTSRMSVSGQFENFLVEDLDGKKTRSGILYARTNYAEGTFINADGANIPFVMDFEWLQKPRVYEIQVLIILKFSDGDARVGITSKNHKATVHINGEQISERDAKNIYGLDKVFNF